MHLCNQPPASLKVLFRPVALVCPPAKAIAQAKLTASGFTEAGAVAENTVSVLQLVSTQLPR